MSPRKGPSSRTKRPGLTSERVLEAAMKMADESGIDSVTMRRVGEALGVEAMSLYNHVDGKDAILDGILGLVLGEIELPSSDDGWDVAVRRCATSAHRLMLAHPWACNLAMVPTSGSTGGIGRLRYIEALLRCFREAGFSRELAYRAYHAIDSHILGFTMWEVGHTIGLGAFDGEVAQRLMEMVAAGGYPYLLEHAEQHGEDVVREPDDFEFGLELVIDGIRRIREAEIASARHRPGRV